MRYKAYSLLLAVFMVLSVAFAPIAFAQYNQMQDQNTAPLSYEDIPEEYLLEAENFQNGCFRDSKFYRYFNCECLAQDYLDERITLGDGADRSYILPRITERNDCRDAQGAAAYYYGQCLNRISLIGVTDIEPDTYCKCFGGVIAQIYNEGRAGTGTNDAIAVQKGAYRQCEKYGYAEENYGSESGG